MPQNKVQKQLCKFLTAADVASILETSEATAYRIIKKLNSELKDQGKIVVPGKIPRRYFEEKVVL
jgi:ribosomal protein L18E